MFGNYFYHQRTRTAVATFGKLFNDIYVLRKNKAGAIVSTLKVPLSYGPKQKFLERIAEQADLVEDDKVAIKLPRMSFEITGISYDTSRQLPKSNDFNRTGSTANTRNKFRSGQPYVINFDLSVFAKSQDDALQVVEQIIPYFSPQYTLTIKPFSDFDTITEDVPIILSGVNLQNEYQGDVGGRQTIEYNLSFEMHIYFHGPISDQDIVRKVNANTFLIGAGNADSDIPLSRISTTPTPIGVSADSDFGFSTVIVDAIDSDAGV